MTRSFRILAFKVLRTDDDNIVKNGDSKVNELVKNWFKSKK